MRITFASVDRPLQSCDTTPHTGTHNTVRTIGVLYVAINILQSEENIRYDYHSENLIIIGLTCLPPPLVSPSSPYSYHSNLRNA